VFFLSLAPQAEPATDAFGNCSSRPPRWFSSRNRIPLWGMRGSRHVSAFDYSRGRSATNAQQSLRRSSTEGAMRTPHHLAKWPGATGRGAPTRLPTSCVSPASTRTRAAS